MLRATSSPKATPQDPNGSGGDAIWVESGLHGAGRWIAGAPRIGCS